MLADDLALRDFKATPAGFEPALQAWKACVLTRLDDGVENKSTGTRYYIVLVPFVK